ncbi:MAG: hypothetical protein BAJALOKI2v1_260006 [Promethearchaeota archaeon]|nr:MAG: hypothetical protein BAJALOKI2v1_260006 [Candidatus Lokiarchaeota archaeon]
MTACGNVVELVKKSKIKRELSDFILWKRKNNGRDLEVYIEKEIIPELKQKKTLEIDVALGEIKGNSIGILFLKKDSNVYG